MSRSTLTILKTKRTRMKRTRKGPKIIKRSSVNTMMTRYWRNHKTSCLSSSKERNHLRAKQKLKCSRKQMPCRKRRTWYMMRISLKMKEIGRETRLQVARSLTTHTFTMKTRHRLRLRPTYAVCLFPCRRRVTTAAK